MEAALPFATQPILLTAAGALAVALGATKGHARLTLSRAKHRSLAGHARMSLRVARFVPTWSYDEHRFFRADGAPEEIARQRQAGFEALADLYKARFAKTAALTKEAAQGLSDLQFTGVYRVPFQFSRIVRENLSAGSFLQSSDGVTITDLDGNRLYDLAGSYGVNLLGFDAYKRMIAEGAEQVADLGPVLGAFHPVVADNFRRLKAISGLDELSFHMSGTEAVMQAVRLARYHTKRTHAVRFCGAYHGWWGDVQPGVGNPTPADYTYTLADMSEKSLKVLATRKNIACVLVNPLQGLHPNSGAPGDNTLVDSSRKANFDKEAYGAWLRRLAEVCRNAGIVLIFDEVFVGFRLARGGAAEYFGVKPDMITYGKTLGGGLPVGVLCGRHEVMKRYRDDKPVDICFARGTFNSHPYVMGAMNAFLRFLDTEEGRVLYDGLDDRWNARARLMNAKLAEAGLPIEVSNISTIWTVRYTRPSRYNWMLQYYLRAEGLALSWVGTGRLIFSLNYTDADFAEVVDRFVRAAGKMEADGWWWSDPQATNKTIRRGILKEMVAAWRGKR